MTGEEYDRQNRIKKLKSFESDDTLITNQPGRADSYNMEHGGEIEDDIFDTSSIRLSTEAHMKRRMFRKVT